MRGHNIGDYIQSQGNKSLLLDPPLERRYAAQVPRQDATLLYSYAILTPRRQRARIATPPHSGIENRLRPKKTRGPRHISVPFQLPGITSLCAHPSFRLAQLGVVRSAMVDLSNLTASTPLPFLGPHLPTFLLSIAGSFLLRELSHRYSYIWLGSKWDGFDAKTKRGWASHTVCMFPYTCSPLIPFAFFWIPC